MTAPLDYATLPLPLTPVEAEDLHDYEATIERGLNTFYEVAAAFVHIKQRKLYRVDYRTFEEYCKEKWNIDRSYADRMIEAAEVRQNLVPIGTVLPEKESHARALVGLTPEQQRQVWPKALETAPNGKVTAQHIKDVRQVEIPMPEPDPAPAAAPPKQISVFLGDVVPGTTRKIIEATCQDCGATYVKPEDRPELIRCGSCSEAKLRGIAAPVCPMCKSRFPLGLETLPDGRKICYICKDKLTTTFTQSPKTTLDDDPDEREPEIEEQFKDTLGSICADCGTEIAPGYEEEYQGHTYHANCHYQLTRLKPEPAHMCNFCGETLPAAQVYSHSYNDRTEQHHICRACASNALADLGDDQPFAWQTQDREKIANAGLRVFRAAWGDPREKRFELRELLPPKHSHGSSRSWQVVEAFESKAALQRRIKELEQDEHIVFENRI